MRFFVMGVATLTLTGCVAYSLHDVLAEAPEGVYRTKKTVEEYSACLDYQWLNRGPTILRDRPEGEKLILAEFNTHVIAAATVKDTKEYTEVTYYFPNPLQRKGFGEDVKNCL